MLLIDGKGARSIMDIYRKDRIRNVEVRARTGQQTMDNTLRERRLRYRTWCEWISSAHHSKRCTVM